MTFIFNSLKLAILILSMVFIAALGPEVHSGVMRYYVGTKTVKITFGRSGGSGFFVKAPSGKTFILTNRHVCNLSTNGTINITLPKTGRMVTKDIIQKYSEHDLCLIEGDASYTGLDIADYLYIGQTIGLVGHPKLQPLTLSKGEYIGDRLISVVVGYDKPRSECPGKTYPTNKLLQFMGLNTVCVQDYYAGQITAYSRGGSSGSPIVNFSGDIVGVLFAGNPSDPFESFIVLLDDVKNFLQDY